MATFGSLFGHYMLHFSQIPSTHDWLFDRMDQYRDRPGMVVSSDFQTEGIGQRGNVWESDPGDNLLISCLRNHLDLAAKEAWDLNAIVSLSVVDLVSYYTNKPIQIKWPNDVFSAQGKIGGILVKNLIRDNVVKDSVMSAGVNVNQMEFTEGNYKATSIQAITGKKIDLVEAKWLFIGFLKTRMGQSKRNRNQLVQDFKSTLYGFNKLVEANVKGWIQMVEIENIMQNGELIIKDESGSYLDSETLNSLKFIPPYA